MSRVTPAKAIRRVTGDLTHLLTPEARRWIVGWLVGTAARGMPMPHLYGLASDSYVGKAFSDTALHAEWEFPADRGLKWVKHLRVASLTLGPGPERWWWCDDDLMSDHRSHEANVNLDGPTTTRIVILLRWMAHFEVTLHLFVGLHDGGYPKEPHEVCELEAFLVKYRDGLWREDVRRVRELTVGECYESGGGAVPEWKVIRVL